MTGRMMVLVVACLLVFPAGLFADEIEDLKKEIQSLSERLEVLEAESEEQGHELFHAVDFSGYADVEAIRNTKKGEENEFRVHHLALFFIKRISERWRVFSEVEFEDAPRTAEDQGDIFIEVFTVEYTLNPYANFRMGRFLTPGGIWNVEHYPPFVLTQERPQHIRRIFPQLSDGVQFRGSLNRAGVITDYILYVVNGTENHDPGQGDDNENKAVGARAKFALHFLDRVGGFRAPEIGVSYYRERDALDVSKRIGGLDLRLDWKDLRFQGEYTKGFYDPEGASLYRRAGYYGQIAYNYGKWTMGYRYDWYDPDSGADNDRNTIHTIALNYHFTPHVVAKLEHHFVDPQDPAEDNYTKTLLSVAAYLGD